MEAGSWRSCASSAVRFVCTDICDERSGRLLQMRVAADPFYGIALCRQLPRPRECRFCSALHECRYRPDRRSLWPRRGHVLHRLLLLRNSLERGDGEIRRAALDLPHHADLGRRLHGDGICHRPGELLHPALSARCLRSRVLPGHDSLSYLLVSRVIARPVQCAVPVGDHGGEHHRRAGLRLHPALDGRYRRIEELAMAVPAGRPAVLHPRLRHLAISAQQTGGGEMVERRGKECRGNRARARRSSASRLARGP